MAQTFKITQVMSAINYHLELPKQWSIHPVFVTISPCPSPKQAGSDKIAALKRRACDFMGQPRTDDNAGLSYLESVDTYEYDTLAIGRMIVSS
jgi:hypothetical protein